VSPEVLRAYVGSKDTQIYIVSVIRRGLAKRTPDWIVRDIASNVNAKVLGTLAGPRDESRMRGWLVTVTVNARNSYFREGAANAKWINPEAAVEELPPDPADAPEDEGDEAAPSWLIGPWLEKRVAGNPDDKAAYELIVERARGGKSYAELAAERGETVNALTKRVQRLKAKYVPLRRRANERRHTLMLLLRFGGAILAIAAVVVLAYLLDRWQNPRPQRMPPAPASSASAAPPFRAPPPVPADTDLTGHPAPP
jgi:DNA-directed RNA polymerase specialized sigma24 family protein